MKVESLLEIISANYHFQVKQHAKLDELSYRLETNHGPKRLSMWTNPALLEWAFRWRERMADKGFRQLDRFIRTKNGTAYVQVEGTYVVVQELFEGEVLTLTTAEQYKLVGQFVGAWYQNCTEAAQNLTEMKQKQQIMFWPNQQKARIEEIEELQAYKQKIATLSDSMFTILIRQHWSSLKKRFRQALFLERASQASERKGLFPRTISIDQWRRMEEGYVVFQAMDQQVCPDLRSVANLLRSLYMDNQASIIDIEHFYTGFSEAYKANINTHYQLLGQLIYPGQFLEIISGYISKEKNEAECIEAWLKACQEQDRLDELHLWLANFIDQGKQERGLG